MKDQPVYIDGEKIPDSRISVIFRWPPGIPRSFERSALVVGSRGVGKTTLFRYLKDQHSGLAVHLALAGEFSCFGKADALGPLGSGYTQLIESLVANKAASLLALALGERLASKKIYGKAGLVVDGLPKGIGSVPKRFSARWCRELKEVVAAAPLDRFTNGNATEMLRAFVADLGEKTVSKKGDLLLLLDRADMVVPAALKPIAALLDQSVHYVALVAMRPGHASELFADQDLGAIPGDHYDVVHIGREPYTEGWESFLTSALEAQLGSLALEGVPEELRRHLLTLSRDSLRTALELGMTCRSARKGELQGELTARLGAIRENHLVASQRVLQPYHRDYRRLVGELRKEAAAETGHLSGPVLLTVDPARQSEIWNRNTRLDRFLNAALRSRAACMPTGEVWVPGMAVRQVEIPPVVMWDEGDPNWTLEASQSRRLSYDNKKRKALTWWGARVALLSAVLLAASASGELRPVDVSVVAAAGQKISVLVRHSADKAGWLVETPWSGVVNLEQEAEETLSVVAGGYWVERRGEAAGSALSFRIHAGSTLKGDLIVPDRSNPGVGQISLTLSVDVGEGDRIRDVVECAVSASSWFCRVPAGNADLRFESDGYQPVFLWDVNIKPDSEVELEPLRWVQGGSIEGTIVGDVELDTEQVVVEAHRLYSTQNARPEERDRFELLALSTRATGAGRFRLAGLTPGEYRVRAHAGPGLMSQDVSVLLPSEESEVSLEQSLELLPSAQFDVFLGPEVDPFGEPWEIRLTRERRNRLRVESYDRNGTASLAGHWLGSNLPPGLFTVAVEDSQGSTWLREKVDLKQGENLQSFEIEIVPVRGSIALGKDPVVATVVFGSHNGLRSISMTSDDSGVFRGGLPAEGEWPVEILYPGAKGVQNGGLVPVRYNVNKGYAPVDIELNDNRISGYVTLDGEPTKAFIVALRAGPRGGGVRKQFVIESDNDGAFGLSGLPEGPIKVYAYRDGARSEGWRRFEIGSRTVIEDIELELHAELEIRGRLLFQSRPTAGALIVPFGGGLQADSSTGVDGRFSMRVSKSSPWLDVVVVPPEGGAFLYRLVRSAGAADEQVIEVPVASGSLIVGPRVASLSSNGALVPLDYVLRALAETDRLASAMGGLLLKNVAVGIWKACGTGDEGGDCKWVTVESGTQASIVLPTQEAHHAEN